MDFWTDYSALFFLGFIFIPRLMLIYYGSIPAFSVGSIIEMMFIPRIFMAGLIAPIYWDSNPKTVVAIWVIAIVGDLVGNIFKFRLSATMWRIQKEQMNYFRSYL